MNGNHERTFITLSISLFSPWIAGIILSVILVAVMPTLSCQLLVCSSTITGDSYKGFLRKHVEQKELVQVGRMTVLAMAVIATLTVADPEGKVLGLVSYVQAGFGAVFGLVVTFSVLWKRIVAYGVLSGMITDVLTMATWAGWVKKPALAAHDTSLLTLYEIAPGLVVCALVTVLVSLIGRVPSSAIAERFEKANAKYKAAK